MDLTHWCGSRKNGDHFSITEAAKARPSIKGSPGTCYPVKSFRILILLSAIPWAFELFWTGYWLRFKIKVWKIYFYFKKLCIFQKSDRFT